LNDSAQGAAGTPDELLGRLRASGLDVDCSFPQGGRLFAEGGFAIWQGTPWTVFFDVGPLGPDFQPGHGHADNLSLECSCDGMRLFVDPGTHSYDRDERRAYDRSTAAHNTVCVDQTNSSEVWHIFRVGRRARPFDVQFRCNDASCEASAAHDGYAHLGSVIHCRRIEVGNRLPLVVVDRLEGGGERYHEAEGGWLLAPGWSAAPIAGGWELHCGSRTVRVRVDSPAALDLTAEIRPWHPQFGIELPTTRLLWRWKGTLPLEVKTIVESETGPSR